MDGLTTQNISRVSQFFFVLSTIEAWYTFALTKLEHNI